MSKAQKQNMFNATMPILISLPGVYYFVKFLFENKNISQIVKISIPVIMNTEAKLSLFFTLLSFIALVITLNVILVIICRGIFNNTNPIDNNDHKIIIVLNRVLLNTLEQSAIFVPLLGNFIFSQSTKENLYLAVNLSLIWILGRVIFLVCYLIGSMINLPAIRGAGFMTSLFPSAYLIAKFVGSYISLHSK